MSLDNFAARLGRLGCDVTVMGNDIEVDVDEHKIKIECNADWVRDIGSFYRARQYSYNSERRVLNANRFAEYQLTRLDPGYFHRSEHFFSDGNGCQVHLGAASTEFMLSYFESDRYETTFTRIRERIARRIAMRRRRRDQRVCFKPDDLLFRFYTARYTVPRKPRNATVDSVAADRVRACLFSLANRKERASGSGLASQHRAEGRYATMRDPTLVPG